MTVASLATTSTGPRRPPNRSRVSTAAISEPHDQPAVPSSTVTTRPVTDAELLIGDQSIGEICAGTTNSAKISWSIANWSITSAASHAWYPYATTVTLHFSRGTADRHTVGSIPSLCSIRASSAPARPDSGVLIF